MQQRVQGAGVDRPDRLALGQQPFGDGVDREPDGRLRRALGVAGLEHEQPAVLDRELRVLHVLVVALERPQDLHQLGVGVGQPPAHFANVARRPDPGDDVLALGIGQEVAARLGRAGDLVARERHPGPRGRALIAEHHLLDVDRRPPLVRDVIEPPVGDRPLAKPGIEHRVDRLAQLLARVLRELLARVLGEDPLEGLSQLLAAPRRRARCPRSRRAGTWLRDRVLEQLARDPTGDVAQHLHEAPIGIPREPLVVRRRGETQPTGRSGRGSGPCRASPASTRAPRSEPTPAKGRRCRPALARRALQPRQRRRHLLGHPFGRGRPRFMYSTHASVVIVNPAGTRSAPSTRVISATLAPLPPSSARISREPSAKS